MKCSLCEKIIHSEITGFAKLPCNHIYHIRCLVPACDNYYNIIAGDIGCRICKVEPKAEAEPKAEPEAEAEAIPPVLNDAELAVDDAYQIVDLKMRDYLNKEKNRLADSLTKQDKALLDKYLQTAKEYTIIKRNLKKQIKNTVNEFKNEVKHLVSIFNDNFRNSYDKLILSDNFKVYIKYVRKYYLVRREIDDLYQRITGPTPLLNESFSWMDLFELAGIKNFRENHDNYIPMHVQKDLFTYKFNLSKELYDLSKNRTHVNKLFRESVESAEESEQQGSNQQLQDL